MKVSNEIYNTLGKLITGDEGASPYMTGPELVEFFNVCGFNDTYGPGFPSRWMYAAEKVQKANDTNQLKHILEKFVDPRRYRGNQDLLQKIVKEINEVIKYDGFSLVLVGKFYKITDGQSNFITPETTTAIGHEFIIEQIKKCNDKIATSDYNGAITNARTLTEATLIHIIETTENTEIKNSGDLIDLWKQAKKL